MVGFNFVETFSPIVKSTTIQTSLTIVLSHDNNLSTIQFATNLIQHSRTKHIELDLYFIRKKVITKQVDVRHIPTQDQVAVILTKAVSSSLFFNFKSKLRIKDFTTLSFRERVRIYSSLSY